MKRLLRDFYSCKSMSEELDISAYPVLRIDQIPKFNDEFLSKNISDASDLISSLLNESEVVPPLVPYLRKQLKVVSNEITERSARKRVQKLIKGEIDPSSRKFETEVVKITVRESRSAPDPPNPRSLVKGPDNAQTCVEQSTKVSAEIQENPKNLITKQAATETMTQEQHCSPSKKDAPSRKSQVILSQNFGSTFVVAATEKRKRFYPAKKVAAESESEIRAKAQQERRKLALERLLARKERQQELLLKRNSLKREREAARGALLSGDDGPSSGSESLSDDDKEVKAEPAAVVDEVTLRTIAAQSLGIVEGKEESDAALAVDVKSSRSVMAETKAERSLGSSRSVTSEPASAPKLPRRRREVKTTESAAKPVPRHALKEKAPVSSLRSRSIAALPPSPPKEDVAADQEEQSAAAEAAADGVEADVLGEEIAAKNAGALSVLRGLKLKKAQKLVESPRRELSPMAEAVAEDSSKVSTPSPVPNVDTIDTMLKASQLLRKEDDVIRCQHSADSLPGLCAWKLVSVTDSGVEWCVRLDEYQAGVKIDFSGLVFRLFEQRKVLRKRVSQGLVLLLLECEDLLLGKMAIHHEDSFVALWEEYIRLFDRKADDLSRLQEGYLFETVTVCGNGFAVCKKLENLLKSYFMKKNKLVRQVEEFIAAESQLDTSGLAGEEGEVGSTLLLSDLSTLHVTDSMHPILSPQRSPRVTRTPHSPTRQLAGGDGSPTNAGVRPGSRQLRWSDPDSSVGDDMAESVQRLAGRVIAAVDEAVEAADKSTPTDSQSASATQEAASTADVDDADDDASILPVYGSEPPLWQQSVAVATASPITADMLKLKLEHAIKINQEVIASNQKVAAPMPRVVATAKSVLTEIYPHFGYIFPVAYNNLGAKNQDSASAARQLIETMQLQAKVYEEWLEVMSDYSTVFCEERAVQETANVGASAAIYKGGTRSLHFRVKSSRSEVNNIITDMFNSSLPTWEELPAGLGLGLSWNLLWTWSKPHINMAHLLVWQRVNHFQDSKQLTRKDLLKRNIQLYMDLSHKGMSDFDIIPQTFILPHEYTAFVQAFMEEAGKKTEGGAAGASHNMWIVKPIGLSRGRGISLISDLNELSYSQASVVQKYIERPLCLAGYKFDLRLYVVVTSFKPLEAFIYQDGFARVSTLQYTLDPTDKANKFVHLTNSSIQKQNPQGATMDNPLRDEVEEAGGSKISLLGTNGLWKRLEQFGINSALLWEDICLLVLKSLMVVDDRMTHQPCCFELFGYDVLIDADLHPWLIEVNASPSLARENALDVRVKNAMIRDMVLLLDPAPFDRAAVARILKRRLNSMLKNKVAVVTRDADLEKDLKDILGDHVPRRHGEVPKQLGQYEMLCPGTKSHAHILRLKKKIIKS